MQTPGPVSSQTQNALPSTPQEAITPQIPNFLLDNGYQAPLGPPSLEKSPIIAIPASSPSAFNERLRTGSRGGSAMAMEVTRVPTRTQPQQPYATTTQPQFVPMDASAGPASSGAQMLKGRLHPPPKRSLLDDAQLPPKPLLTPSSNTKFAFPLISPAGNGNTNNSNLATASTQPNNTMIMTPAADGFVAYRNHPASMGGWRSPAEEWISASKSTQTHFQENATFIQNWITVFGITHEMYSLVLKEFSNAGEIVRHIPGTGNWIHIQFETPLQAKAALSKPLRILRENTMIGVVECTETHLINSYKHGPREPQFSPDKSIVYTTSDTPARSGLFASPLEATPARTTTTKDQYLSTPVPKISANAYKASPYETQNVPISALKDYVPVAYQPEPQKGILNRLSDYFGF